MWIPEDFPSELILKILNYADSFSIESILTVNELAYLHRFICVVVEKFNIRQTAKILVSLGVVEKESIRSLNYFFKDLQRKGHIVTRTGAVIVLLGLNKTERLNLDRYETYNVLKQKINLFITSNELDAKMVSDSCRFKFEQFVENRVDVDDLDIYEFSTLFNKYFSSPTYKRKAPETQASIKFDSIEKIAVSQYDFLTSEKSFERLSKASLVDTMTTYLNKNREDIQLRDDSFSFQDYMTRLGILLILVQRTRVKVLYNLLVDTKKSNNKSFQTLELQHFNLEPSVLSIRHKNCSFEALELNKCSIFNDGVKLSIPDVSNIKSISVLNPKCIQYGNDVYIPQLIHIIDQIERFRYISNQNHSNIRVKFNDFQHVNLRSLSLTGIAEFRNITLPSLKHLRLIFGKKGEHQKVLMNNIECPKVKYLEIVNYSSKMLDIHDCFIGYKPTLSLNTDKFCLVLSDTVNLSSFFNNNCDLMKLAGSITLKFLNLDYTNSCESLCFFAAKRVILSFETNCHHDILNKIDILFPFMEELTVINKTGMSTIKFALLYNTYLENLPVKKIKWV